MALTDFQKIRQFVVFILIAVSQNGCYNKNEFRQWNDIEIDPKISGDSNFKQLDNQTEIFSFGEIQESLMKKTSDVSYFHGQRNNLQNQNFAKLNNCRAYFFNSETLSINTGIGSGFVDIGFIINCKNHKFYTEPYFTTDVVGEVESTYKIVYQNLDLDKSNYKSEDSLYGKIDFKSIETDKDKNRTEHFGKGYFRTKIKKI